MNIQHPKLVKLLKLAYSAEKAAAFAYIGHAGSVKNPDEKVAIKQIEMDEWQHRETVLSIMRQYEHNWLLPLFERIFGWGNKRSFNDVDLENKSSVEESKGYCKR